MRKITLLIALITIALTASAQNWTSFNSYGFQRKINGTDTVYRVLGAGVNTPYLYLRSDNNYIKTSGGTMIGDLILNNTTTNREAAVKLGFVDDYFYPTSAKSGVINPNTYLQSGHFRVGTVNNPFYDPNLGGSGASGFSSFEPGLNGWQLLAPDLGEFRLKGRTIEGGIVGDWVDIYPAVPKEVQYVTETVPNTSNFAIRASVEAITDASPYKRYTLIVPNGTYFELDIRTKDYIDIVGQSREGVIINFDGNSTAIAPLNLSLGTGGVPINTIPNEYKHIFWAVKTSKVSNMTLNCTNAKYAIHQDALGDYEATFENITINQGSIIRPVGIGSRHGQKQIYRNCFLNNLSNTWAIGWHNWNNQNGGSSLLIDNSVSAYGLLIAEDLGSGYDDVLTIKNSRSVNMTESQIVSAGVGGYYVDPSTGNIVTDPLLIPYNIKLTLDNSNLTVFQTTRPNYTVFNYESSEIVGIAKIGTSNVYPNNARFGHKDFDLSSDQGYFQDNTGALSIGGTSIVMSAPTITAYGTFAASNYSGTSYGLNTGDQDLQSVTDKGFTTTNGANFGGNVGIGTNSPSAKLDVTGSIRASSNDGNSTSVVRNADLGNYVTTNTNQNNISGAKVFTSPITVTADPVSNLNVIRVQDLATQGKEAAVNIFSSANTTFPVVDSTFGYSTNLAIYVDASTAAVNIILPSVGNTTGKKILIFKIDSSANAVTINGPGASIYINGSPTYTLTSQYASVEIHANSTQYYAK